jgi:nucleoside triphosphate diphosphatase
MQDRSALGRALAVVRDLRKRCAWDRAQTRDSLRPYLVEEVLELDHALGEGDPGGIRDELSDLLLHLAFQLVIAEERREFTAEDVVFGLEQKMRRRHPHLFDLGEAEPWEQIKRRERRGRTLAGVTPTLPPLLKAYRLQERAASVGFDWPDTAGPLVKVREEVREVEQELAHRWSAPARSSDDPNAPMEPAGVALVGEIGDLLFAVVNLARKAGVDPATALDGANRKFVARFEEVERLADARGIDLEQAGFQALDELWDEVKRGTATEGVEIVRKS